MGKTNYKLKFILLIITVLVLILLLKVNSPHTDWLITAKRKALPVCPSLISEQTITPLNNTKHFLVSAFMDQRVKGFDLRIIGMFRRDSIQPLYCLFCCDGQLSETSPTKILQHPDNFGFPFVATDVMCQIPQNCNTTHITLSTESSRENVTDLIWLPIRNKKTNEKKMMNFTVCVSNLFGDYNNVLQFAQTLEMYRLLGVNRVVIYKTSCGPDLDNLLQIYAHEGFVEIVPWPIDNYLNASRGWLFSKHGGDIHYFGQLTTLNECIYRSMERSRYVLLNDIDEIIMPYQYNDLMSLMAVLQQNHPKAGAFLIENHTFSRRHFEPSGKFHLPQWGGVPGVNILEHIYREDPDRKIYHPHKIIAQPRMVEQTSVHEVLKYFGQVYKVPLDVCRIIHISLPPQESFTIEQLNVDKRLWDFQEKLIPKVDKVLKKTGLLMDRSL